MLHGLVDDVVGAEGLKVGQHFGVGNNIVDAIRVAFQGAVWAIQGWVIGYAPVDFGVREGRAAANALTTGQAQVEVGVAVDNDKGIMRDVLTYPGDGLLLRRGRV